MMKAILIAASVALAACAGSAETRGVNALAIACDTYATVLDQLTPLRADGTLSERQIARVNSANALVDPACASDSSLDPASAIMTVREGISLVRAVKEAI